VQRACCAFHLAVPAGRTLAAAGLYCRNGVTKHRTGLTDRTGRKLPHRHQITAPVPKTTTSSMAAAADDWTLS